MSSNPSTLSHQEKSVLPRWTNESSLRLVLLIWGITLFLLKLLSWKVSLKHEANSGHLVEREKSLPTNE
jgi:hypothetical protein